MGVFDDVPSPTERAAADRSRADAARASARAALTHKQRLASGFAARAREFGLTTQRLTSGKSAPTQTWNGAGLERTHTTLYVDDREALAAPAGWTIGVIYPQSEYDTSRSEAWVLEDGRLMWVMHEFGPGSTTGLFKDTHWTTVTCRCLIESDALAELLPDADYLEQCMRKALGGG